MKVITAYHIGIYPYHDGETIAEGKFWLAVPEYDLWGDTLIFIDDEEMNDEKPEMQLHEAIKQAFQLKKDNKYLAYLPIMIVTKEDAMLLENDNDIVEALLRFQ